MSDCNQVISIVHYYHGDGFAQDFVVNSGGGLVHITIIGYVNKLTILDALLQFSSGFYILLTADWWPSSFWHKDDPKACY